MSLLTWALNKIGTPADFEVGPPQDLYLRRWFVIPRNSVFNIYLHQFLCSDDDRALHDHPWAFNATYVVHGSYTERTIAAGGVHKAVKHSPGAFKFRWGPSPHRVVLEREQVAGIWHANKSAPAITLFFTGPVVRGWGFHCPSGWVPWRKFVEQRDGGNQNGAGCEQ